MKLNFFKIFLLAMIFATAVTAQVNLLTANGGNDRTNANLQETQLTPATVIPGRFGKIGSLPVDGQVYSQPLYMSGLSFPDGEHNVLFVSTMHNSVYAYDADSPQNPQVLWQVNLGPSVPAAMLYTKYSDISPEVGILGTGTIDPQRGVLYVVSENLQDGAPVFYLHALSIISGAELMNGPVMIQGSAQNVFFDPQQHIQRPGLLVANDAVYMAFGSHADQSPWHGWLMSYDASDLTRQLGVLISTPDGEGGAIWQSGRGLAADDRGSVYFMTGNGDYDGQRNFSQSILKVTGAAATSAGVFTPANWQTLNDIDADLSTGVALIPGTHTVMGGDKYGEFYLVNGDSMATGDAQSFSGVVVGGMFNFALWSSGNATYVYVQGFHDALKCFAINGSSFNPAPFSVASVAVASPRVGMTLSANGSQDGILWETTQGATAASGTLHAYDASNLATELWNSDLNPDQDRLGVFVKFANPTVANGKVYVPTHSGYIAVYGNEEIAKQHAGRERPDGSRHSLAGGGPHRMK